MLNSIEKSLEDLEASYIRPDNPSISNHYQPDVSIDTSRDDASLNPPNRRDFLPQNSPKSRKEHNNMSQSLILYENPQITEETKFSEEKDDDNHDNPPKCEKLILGGFQEKGEIQKLKKSSELSLEGLNDLRCINPKFSCFAHENMKNVPKSRKTEISMEKHEEFIKNSQDSPNKYFEFILGDHIENDQISRNWEVLFSLNSKQMRSNDNFYLMEHSRSEFSLESRQKERSYEKNNKYLIFLKNFAKLIIFLIIEK